MCACSCAVYLVVLTLFGEEFILGEGAVAFGFTVAGLRLRVHADISAHALKIKLGFDAGYRRLPHCRQTGHAFAFRQPQLPCGVFNTLPLLQRERGVGGILMLSYSDI